MRRKMWIVMALILVVPGLMLTTSCAKKAVKKGEGMEQTDDAAEKARQAELERQKKLEEQRMKEEALKAEMMKKAREKFENDHVLFAYDSSVLDNMAQNNLKNKAAWLQDNSGSKVLIEGHCDERGTVEYNLALGDRRAESAKRFLISLGVDPARITTVSFGEERPLEMGEGEGIWAKNRRAQFVVK